ncbi:hypothetical protein D3C86_1688890 [compost metagenome]
MRRRVYHDSAGPEGDATEQVPYWKMAFPAEITHDDFVALRFQLVNVTMNSLLALSSLAYWSPGPSSHSIDELKKGL